MATAVVEMVQLMSRAAERETVAAEMEMVVAVKATEGSGSEVE